MLSHHFLNNLHFLTIENVVNILLIIMVIIWLVVIIWLIVMLVGGAITILKNDGVRQWGWDDVP